LVVTDPEQLPKVNRPRLSASTAKAIGLVLRRTTHRHRVRRSAVGEPH